MAQNGEVAVVCTNFEEFVIRPIPAIEKFFNHVLALSQGRPNLWRVALSARREGSPQEDDL